MPYTNPMLPKHRAPIWLMGLSNATFGLVGGFIVLPLPQLLAARGVPELRIAAISAACLSPGFWVFLVCPLLDLRFTRRFYATVFAALAGISLSFAILMRAHLLVLETAVMISYTAAVLSSNALGGWLAGILPQIAEQDRDDRNHETASLSAWTQVGSFLGGGIIATVSGEAFRNLPLSAAAVLLGALVILPAAIFPFIPALITGELHPGTSSARESFRNLFHDLRALLKRRQVILTLLLFLAPTGAFALTNQLGGLAVQFQASNLFVSRMGGAVLSIAGAAGCLLLPILSRWIKALPLYLLIGTVGSVFTLALLLLPLSPTTFAIAFLAENVMQALSFTAAVAICFQTIGSASPLAATQFSLLTSATVLPILYMGVLDGRVYSGLSGLHGIKAMYIVDGSLSIAACALMALILWRMPLTQVTERLSIPGLPNSTRVRDN